MPAGIWLQEAAELGAFKRQVPLPPMTTFRCNAEQANSVIPPFDDSGCLPPGLHRAGLAEVEARFGRRSELRRVQMESVRWMVDLAVRAGVQRIVLNGSFVTDIMDPNDVDCVLLAGRGSPRDRRADKELRAGLPFLDIAIVRRKDFEKIVNVIFATDRFDVPKGVVEVVP